MITFENISDKELAEISKILDVSIPNTITRDRAKEILVLYGKYDDFCSILKFLNDTRRTSIKQFTFKIQKIVQKHISSLPYYKNCDWNALNSKLQLLKQSNKYDKSSFYKNKDDLNGKWILHIDIKSANYTSLRLLSDNTLPPSWDIFLQQLAPSDIRSDNNHNREQGTIGLETAIPECFYRSKYFRLFCISNLQNNLRTIWELYNHTLLQKYSEMGLPNKIYVASDEFFIELDNPLQADQIINSISPDPSIFRCQSYQLYRVNEFINTITNKEITLDTDLGHSSESSQTKPSINQYPMHYIIRIHPENNKYSLYGCNSDDLAALTKYLRGKFPL